MYLKMYADEYIEIMMNILKKANRALAPASIDIISRLNSFS